jgi:hypothetical protein
MQKKYLIRAALIMLMITGSYLILWSTSKTSAGKETCCESMEECIQKKDKTDPAGEMIWENFSHQFFSLTGSGN